MTRVSKIITLHISLTFAQRTTLLRLVPPLSIHAISILQYSVGNRRTRSQPWRSTEGFEHLDRGNWSVRWSNFRGCDEKKDEEDGRGETRTRTDTASTSNWSILIRTVVRVAGFLHKFESALVRQGLQIWIIENNSEVFAPCKRPADVISADFETFHDVTPPLLLGEDVRLIKRQPVPPAIGKNTRLALRIFLYTHVRFSAFVLFLSSFFVQSLPRRMGWDSVNDGIRACLRF